jgi:hypothetical protein
MRSVRLGGCRAASARLAIGLLILTGCGMLTSSGRAPARPLPAAGVVVAPRTVIGSPGQVTLIGVPDLRWADINDARTPALAAFLRQAATSVLAVKAAGLPTRLPAGWLTLGAGNRMAGVWPLSPSTVALAHAQTRNAGLFYGARAGALGSALRAAGRTAASAGGPGAAIAVAPAAAPRAGARADLTVLEDSRLYGVAGTARQRAAAGLDRDLAPLLDPRHIGARSVLLVGVCDGPTGGAALHVAAAAGPAFPPGGLVSASTRRPPYVQLIDVAPTVLSLLAVPTPPAMAGTPWRSVGQPAGGWSASAMADLDRHARAGWRWAGVAQTAMVWTVFALVGLAGIAIRRRWRPRARHALAVCGYAVAALPVASYLLQLLPWWRTPAPATLLLALPLGCAWLAVAADRWRPGGGPAVIASVTVGVLGADLASGTHLQTAALLGDSPLLAGRFVGAGNLDSALFTAAGLLLLSLGCRGRRRVVPLAAVAGAAGLVLLGAPQFGADAGGLLAATPALGAFLLRLAGRPLRLRTAGLLAATGVLLLGSAAAVDYARPAATQTHLGRFVGGLLHGGTSGAALRRHLSAAAHSLGSSPFNLSLVLLTALLLAGVRGAWRPQRRALAAVPGLTDGLLVAGVAVLLGGLVNDSGVAVPGVAVCLLLPLVLAATAGAADGGHGNAGVARLGSEVSDPAVHTVTSAIRPRPRLPGARQARGLARYQT